MIIDLIQDLRIDHPLDDERLHLAPAVEQSDECIIIASTEGEILYVNAAFERLTGYRLGEVVGTHPRFLNHDEGQAECQTWLRPFIKAWCGRAACHAREKMALSI